MTRGLRFTEEAATDLRAAIDEVGGAEVFAVGSLDIAVSTETDERPAPGADKEDDGEESRESDTDCEEVGDEDSGDPPPCDVPEEDEGEDEDEGHAGDGDSDDAPRIGPYGR